APPPARLLHAALPGARRGRARAALRPVPLGRRAQRASVRAPLVDGGRRRLLTMRHIPLLRRGTPYRSVEAVRVPHYRTREAVAEVSQAHPGLVPRDLRPESQAAMQAPLAALRTADLLHISARAADCFAHDSLPLGDEAQGPDDYVAQTSATTGLPHVMVRRNLEKIRGVLARMPEVLSGLTRGLDL